MAMAKDWKSIHTCMTDDLRSDKPAWHGAGLQDQIQVFLEEVAEHCNGGGQRFRGLSGGGRVGVHIGCHSPPHIDWCVEGSPYHHVIKSASCMGQDAYTRIPCFTALSLEVCSGNGITYERKAWKNTLAKATGNCFCHLENTVLEQFIASCFLHQVFGIMVKWWNTHMEPSSETLPAMFAKTRTYVLNLWLPGVYHDDKLTHRPIHF